MSPGKLKASCAQALLAKLLQDGHAAHRLQPCLCLRPYFGQSKGSI